jgi:hypothetical protein
LRIGSKVIDRAGAAPPKQAGGIRRHPGEVFKPVIALGTRRLLLGIKHRVELLMTTPTQPQPAVEIG